MSATKESGPQPGVMHPVDKAFYDLVIRERALAWHERAELLRLVKQEHATKGAHVDLPCVCKWCSRD